MAALALLVALLGSGPASAAQATEEQFTLGIDAVNCDDQAPEVITVQQEGCQPAVGAVFTATIQGGEPIGSCTAQAADVPDPITAGCAIAVPYGASVVVLQDPASIPAGYEPVNQGVVFTAPDAPPTGYVGGVLFVNLLVDESDFDALVEALLEKLREVLREVLS